jgi:hypothetical protein
MDKPKSQVLIMRLLAPLAVLAVGKLLETPKLKGALEEVDARTFVAGRMTGRALSRGARNARDNAIWLGAGVAAVTIGIGLIAWAAVRED